MSPLKCLPVQLSGRSTVRPFKYTRSTVARSTDARSNVVIPAKRVINDVAERGAALMEGYSRFHTM